MSVCLDTVSNLEYLSVIPIEFEIRFLSFALLETFIVNSFNVSFNTTTSAVSNCRVVECPTDFNLPF